MHSLINLELILKHQITENFSYGYENIETPPPQASPSLLGSVVDMGSYLGSYYRRMCIE